MGDWESQKRLQLQQRSGALLVELNKHGAFTLSPPGRHQTDQSSEAAQEGAHHQRDSGDEGAEEPQHCQLFRQVKQRQPADPWLNGSSDSVFVCQFPDGGGAICGDGVSGWRLADRCGDRDLHG